MMVIVGTFGVALFYMFIFFVFSIFAQSGLIAYIKGTAVRITPDQFPDLYKQYRKCCRTLEITDIPEIYMLHADGAFNAFATRFMRRHYVVLFSDMVDALSSKEEALNFYIGHELGHIHRNHIFWGTILMPAGVLPLIGSGYSRAREYTCDNYGLACCEDPHNAMIGLAALSAGAQRWKTLSIDKYIEQAQESGSFWMSFHELVSDYPWLVKRVARISSKVNNTSVDLPARNPLAWIIAFFIPRTGASGGAAPLVVVAIMGILAAVAIPRLLQYLQVSREKSVQIELLELQEAQFEYFSIHQKYANNLSQLEYTQLSPLVSLQITQVSGDCFEATGTTKGLIEPIKINCNGLVLSPNHYN